MYKKLHVRLSHLLFIIIVASCGTQLHENDIAQQKINEEAFRNRFRQTPEEEGEKSGISVTPSLSNQLVKKHEIREDFQWKVLMMTGDDSIDAFDNARIKLHKLFSDFGMRQSIQLSRSQKFQVNGVRATSIANFEKAAHDLKVQEGDGCLIHLTSHGKPTGFYIKGQDYLTPSKINQIIKESCGQRPTVLLVSACYAGVFAEPSLQANNRIILAAARKDKTSFGCSAEAEYTYWDGCLVSSLPTSITWFELAQQVEKCIEKKESAGGFARSYPQARFGADVLNFPIRH